ncbi:MAG: hypothetical protein FWC01_05660 [Treponema sp.]|nr:hypothetical protein [Treponema sp.]MCL2238132.1 hypothetical protein [Treponema sp.]
MKQFCILVALIFIFTSCETINHEKGDVVLFIEPYIGYEKPVLDISEANTQGINISLQTTVDYYFTNWFSLNTGFGFAGNIISIENGNYYAYCFSVPLGLRFNISNINGNLTLGTGVNANFPLYASAQYSDYTVDFIPYMGIYADIGYLLGDKFEILLKLNFALNTNYTDNDSMIPFSFGMALKFPIKLGNLSGN